VRLIVGVIGRRTLLDTDRLMRSGTSSTTENNSAFGTTPIQTGNDSCAQSVRWNRLRGITPIAELDVRPTQLLLSKLDKK
jgi:hypothetical protein